MLLIPYRCKHSDILKNILTNCSDLSFAWYFSHVKAHQADKEAFHLLPRESQLNEGCDAKAKQEIRAMDPSTIPPQKPFPLESIAVYVGKEKMTLDTGEMIRFLAHRQLAKEHFHNHKLMFATAFEEVAWWHVCSTLRTLPRLFSLWTGKK